MPLLTELSPTGSPRQISVRSGIFIVPPGHHQLRSGMFIETDTQALRFEQEITCASWSRSVGCNCRRWSHGSPGPGRGDSLTMANPCRLCPSCQRRGRFQDYWCDSSRMSTTRPTGFGSRVLFKLKVPRCCVCSGLLAVKPFALRPAQVIASIREWTPQTSSAERGFKVQGSRFEVQGSRFKVQGSGSTVRGSTVQGSRFKVQGSRFRFNGSRFRFNGSRFKVQRFEVQGSTVRGSRFEVQGSRFKVQGSRFKVQGSTVQGSRFKVRGSRFKVQGSRFNGSRFKVQGSTFRRSKAPCLPVFPSSLFTGCDRVQLCCLCCLL